MRRWAAATVAASCAVVVLTPAPAATGAATAVAEGGNGRIAFASDATGDNEIYTMAADGGQVRQLTDDPADDILPAWSPDGSRIAFTSDRDADTGYDIFVMDADGTNVVNLTDEAGSDRFPAWSRDGSRIAFMSARDRNGNFEVYVMRADGSAPRRLTATEGIEECCLDWGRGDRRIVFQTKRDGDFEIYTMRADGSRERNISQDPAYDGTPTWAPDRPEIVFRSLRGGGDHLYTMTPRGQEAEVLYAAPGSNRTPAWSPDGRQVVFTSDRDGTDDVWVVDADGDNPVNLSNTPRWNETTPDWRPVPTRARAADRRARPDPGCGTWVLQQVENRAALKRSAPAIRSALSHRGVRGLSLRVPWTAVDRGFGVLRRAAAIAERRHKELSVRFLAGRSTPARLFRQGAQFYTSGGDRVPQPFRYSGRTGNPVFERAYRSIVRDLAAWSRRHDVRLLHLPWYGFRWAEIYHGSAVQQARGYRYRAWLRGHLRLLDVALRVSGPKLTIELPLSGDWGGRADAAGRIADRIVDRAGAWNRRVVVQGNGLGRWDAPATNRPVFHGKQMVSAGDFDWRAIYRTLRTNDESYVEVYLASFSGSRSDQLVTQARRFQRDRC